MLNLTRYGVAALAATALLLGCSDDKTGPSGTAQVRVVHGSPDAPAVDVLVDGAVVLNNVAYKDASGYLGVPEGTRNIKVNAAGTATSVINANVADRCRRQLYHHRHQPAGLDRAAGAGG